MKKGIIFNILTTSLLLICCKNISLKSEFAAKDRVSCICLRENDTLYLKITNNSSRIIYVPELYDCDLSLNTDTLHLETIAKFIYSTTKYFGYKHIFPFDFFTTKIIAGYKPDTVINIIKQTTFYNQFKVQPIIPILKDSSYTMTIKFSTCTDANIFSAVYYHTTFLNKTKLDNVEYLLSDFVRFDSLNAAYISGPIITKYK